MTLTTAQLQTLKANIAASEFGALEHTDDNAWAIKEAYNLPASPAFTVWKNAVPLQAVGQAFDGAELEGRTSLQNERLMTFAAYIPEGVTPFRADHRAFFDGVFSGAGGQLTRASLLVLWKRLVSRAERLYTTGTGSDASPGTLGWEGVLVVQDIKNAWNS